MTGLELGHDALIEVAVLVTDSELNVLGDGVDVVIACPPEALESMPDVASSVHGEKLQPLLDGASGELSRSTVWSFLV